MMIAENEIERVKRETDLLALARSRGIELKAHGSKDWIGLCPFHADNEKPNFIITPGKGLFHCMACGAAGNPIQFLVRHDKVSFRHAFELLNHGGSAVYESHRQLRSRASIPRLPSPLVPEAGDVDLLRQVTVYYHERIKLMPHSRAYLATRGLDDEAMIDHFQMGFADRTLGLRLPESNRLTGELLRRRLTQLGIWRETGREHFNGCVVVPLRDEAGNVVSFYGRRCGKTMPGAPKHLYSPGPHQGFFNPEALNFEEIILCEAVFDALTFWKNGFKNVTCIYGTQGFTDELWQAILRKKVQRIRLAYDADEAGEQAAKRDAERMRSHGIEVYRIKFPWGMDANEYARKVTPPDKSLSLLIHAAAWIGTGKAPPLPRVETSTLLPVQSEIVSSFAEASENRPAPAPSSLAAPTNVGVSSSEKEATKEEKVERVLPETSVIEKAVSLPSPAKPSHELELRGDAWFMKLEDHLDKLGAGREYRVTGLEKTLGTDSLKVGLRLKAGEYFHLDQIDFCRDGERRRFVERASEETNLSAELLKKDMGKILLALEQAQAELGKPVEAITSKVMLSAEEREEAIAWLSQPDLMNRLREDFSKSGIIGEETNALVAYLACVSRKLERPLAVIIQSASAAGKTTLMDAVLSFFPEEERIKYSAMTGQSLYYLGETNLKHKILAVVEEAGAEKASYALKLLQSEGELTIASTGKDPQSGKMVTHEYRVEGPVTIMLTTTAIDLDEELQNRCLTLSVNESVEQTQAIHRLQRERRTLTGLVAREERKDLLRKLRNAQRLLQPLEVINPYAPFLAFPSDRTRNRRDHEKYLTLIDACALLHQYQRQRGQREVHGRAIEYIEVTLEDIAFANKLAPEILGRGLDELPPQTRRLLEIIRNMVREKKESHFLFSRRQLRAACGWSLTQVRVHLERLVEHEYLAIRHGRLGNQFLYELLVDVDTSESITHIKLIDVEELKGKCNYNNKPDGFFGVGGGGMAEMPPPPSFPSEKAA